MHQAEESILQKARAWLDPAFDEETRTAVQQLMDQDPIGLTEAFYTHLEFGTGGLRGIMGVGTNRMNRYTVAMATQGLANYLLKCFGDSRDISVAIAYDCRHNSRFFCEVAAEVLSANGIRVYLFNGMRPTPLLSFTVRQLGCRSGIVVTASHNPPEYNGYKVYWDDGGQLVPPHDDNVIKEVRQINNPSQIRFGRDDSLIEELDEAFDRRYIQALKRRSEQPEMIRRQHDMKIVFTPIHGTTAVLAPQALKAFGFTQVHGVPEQEIPDGNFSTVESPNPEDPAALQMAIEKARQLDAELVMGTDPDGDRIGVVVKDLEGEYVLLNGNQTATLITWYLLEQRNLKGLLSGKEYIVKTIVTTELLPVLARHYGVDCLDVLTGFKYIAEIIRRLEGEKQFLAGGEESFGFLVGDDVRDKDAIISACMVAEAAAWAREQGQGLYGLLLKIYAQFGLYHEELLSITKKGKDGLEEIQAMIRGFREQPPASLHGKNIVSITDYLKGTSLDLITGKESDTGLPHANVLRFTLEDGTRITMRPSGTEPKIKFYFGCYAPLDRKEDYPRLRRALQEHIRGVVREMNL